MYITKKENIYNFEDINRKMDVDFNGVNYIKTIDNVTNSNYKNSNKLLNNISKIESEIEILTNKMKNINLEKLYLEGRLKYKINIRKKQLNYKLLLKRKALDK